MIFSIQRRAFLLNQFHEFFVNSMIIFEQPISLILSVYFQLNWFHGIFQEWLMGSTYQNFYIDKIKHMISQNIFEGGRTLKLGVIY